MSFSDNDQKAEEQRLKLTKKAIEENNHMIFEGGMQLPFFVWKLLDYAAITVTKKPRLFARDTGKSRKLS